MKIDINKKYRTKNGYDVRILCVDSRGSFPVIAIIYYHSYDGVAFYTLEGNRYSGRYCGEDLVEVSPYDDFKIDDKVLVWDIDGDLTRKGHFAGLDDFGYPTTWAAGATSFTTNGDRLSWRFCKKYESSDI